MRILTSLLIVLNLIWAESSAYAGKQDLGSEHIDAMIQACHEMKRSGRHTPLPDVFRTYLREALVQSIKDGAPPEYVAYLKKDFVKLNKPGNLRVETWNKFHSKILAIFQWRHLKNTLKSEFHQLPASIKERLFRNLENDIRSDILDSRFFPRVPRDYFRKFADNDELYEDAGLYENVLQNQFYSNSSCVFALYHDLGTRPLTRAFLEHVYPIGIVSKDVVYDAETCSPAGFATHDFIHFMQHLGRRLRADLSDKMIFSKINEIEEKRLRNNLHAIHFYNVHENVGDPDICHSPDALAPDRFSHAVKSVLDNAASYNREVLLLLRFIRTNDLQTIIKPDQNCDAGFCEALKENLQLKNLVPILNPFHKPRPYFFSSTSEYLKTQKTAAFFDKIVPQYCRLHEWVTQEIQKRSP